MNIISDELCKPRYPGRDLPVLRQVPHSAGTKMKQDIRNESNALRSAFGAHFLMRDAVRLLSPWFREHARSLPWREDPTVYHTWVSEIMLQQTRVETVIPYYLRFIDALPDTKALSACPEDRLMKLWEGLGYYSRVRNLQRAAIVIEEKYGGVIPEEREALLSLPGIGAYTAGAILSIALEKPEPVVDGNVLRVVSRILGDRSDIALPETRDAYSDLLLKVIRETAGEISPRVFNQSLMELGALVCIPNGAPRCEDCPVSSLCISHLKDLTDEIPYRSPKKPRNIRQITVLMITDGQHFYITKNKGKGLLSRLYGYLFLEGKRSAEEAAAYVRTLGFIPGVPVRLKPGKHIFTHVEWHMDAWLIRAEDADPDLHRALIPAGPEELKERYALPSAFQKWEKEQKELLEK